jgi:hypothetical protein
MPDANDGGRQANWDEYRRLVLAELERISNDINTINNRLLTFQQKDVADMKTDIALLKFQALLYGSIAGFLATAVLTAVSRFIH